MYKNLKRIHFAVILTGIEKKVVTCGFCSYTRGKCTKNLNLCILLLQSWEMYKKLKPMHFAVTVVRNVHKSLNLCILLLQSWEMYKKLKPMHFGVTLVGKVQKAETYAFWCYTRGKGTKSWNLCKTAHGCAPLKVTRDEVAKLVWNSRHVKLLYPLVHVVFDKYVYRNKNIFVEYSWIRKHGKLADLHTCTIYLKVGPKLLFDAISGQSMLATVWFLNI